MLRDAPWKIEGQQTEEARTTPHNATGVATTIGNDIGKNSFHLIGLNGRYGSKPPV